MDRRAWWGVACVAGLLAGCAGGGRTSDGPLAEDPPEPVIDLVEDEASVRAPEAAPEVADPESYRPAWWIDVPARVGDRVLVAATGEGTDLLDARRAAVGAGRGGLAEFLGREPRGVVETDRASALRLSDGRFRAFVLMSSRE